MRWPAQLRIRIAMLFGRGEAAARLDAEMRDHLERQIAENIAAGMTAEEARYAALRAFGNPALVREQARATWSWTWLELLLRDVRYGARTLMRTPGFAAIAMVVMALGIGANVAMFTIVRSVLLKPLPFTNPDRLVMVYEREVAGDDESQMNPVAGGTFTEWKTQNRTFEDLALAGPAEDNLSGAGGQLPEKIHGVNCSWNLLPLLGVKPALGRGFTAADDQRSANGTVVLSWGLWKRRFGGDAAILNQTIHLNTQAYTVIGILPAGFAYPEDPSVQLLTPVFHDKPADRMESFGDHEFEVTGRLRPGVTAEQGRADLSVISRRVHDEHLDTPVGKGANVRPLLEDMVGNVKRPLYVLLAATGCVLLIACLNVANLLIARGAARRKERAIRMALGGGRMRMLRAHLMEGLLLSAAGGAGGMAFAWGAIQWLAKTRPDLSRVEAVHIDGVVVAFAVGLIVLCALFAGLIGAMGSRENRLVAALQEGSRASSAGQGRVRLRRALLALEVGLTVVLLVAAGLLLKSYERLRASDLGCATQNVLTMRIGLFGSRYREPAQQVNFFSELLTRVRALPGVEAAGFVQAVPGQGYWGDNLFTVVEHPPLPVGQVQFAIYRWADPGYFGALGIPVLRGRSFDAGKRLDNADEVVISKTFADQNLPGEDPIGKHLRVDDRNLTIVGVVGDTRYAPAEDPRPMQYVSLYGGHSNNGTLVIRSSRDAEQLALPVQRIVQSLDRDLAVSNVMTMEQLLGKSTRGRELRRDASGGVCGAVAAAGRRGAVRRSLVHCGAADQRDRDSHCAGGAAGTGAAEGAAGWAAAGDGGAGAGIGGKRGSGARKLRRCCTQRRRWMRGCLARWARRWCWWRFVACAVPAWRASRLDPMTALRTE